MIALLALLGPPTAGRAQDEPLTVEVANFSATDSSTAQAVLTVLDNGRPMADLTKEQFQVQLGDSTPPVTSVTQGVDSSLGIAVVLAMDVSGSMKGAPLDQAKVAARSFLEGLGPQDSVAVLTFANTVQVPQPFTQDRAAAGTTIDGLKVSTVGGTALYDATAESVRLASASGSSRKAVVLLNEGIDEPGLSANKLSQADALAAAQTRGVPVFVIALGSNIEREFLEGLAQESAGLFAEAPSPEGLAQLYQDLGELLRGQYILDLDLSAIDLGEAEAATLRVEVTAGERAGSGERAVCLQATTCAVFDVAAGERLEAERTIAAQVVSAEAVRSVAFLVDGETVAEVTEPPYQFAFDPAAVEQGEHTLEARVTTASGQSATATVAVRTGAAAGAGGTVIALVAVALIAIPALIGVLWFVRWRRRGGEERPAPIMPQEPQGGPEPEAPRPSRPLWEDEPPPPAPEPTEALGRLYVINGPHAGQTFPVGAAPISIGSGHRCLIRLPEGGDDEIASEEARVWVRDSQLMVHEVRRLTVTGSVGGGWSILAPEEVFTVGPWTFRFELNGQDAPEEAQQQEDPPQRPASVGEVPNIFRDVPKWAAPPLRESTSAPEPSSEEIPSAPQPNGSPSADDESAPDLDADASPFAGLWPRD